MGRIRCGTMRPMSARGGARDRFLTTVLMTDIVGSTEHAAELGDAGWRDLIGMHHAIVRGALRQFGGREMDTAGDGFFAIFDAPAAAADCALKITDDVRALGLEVRAGLHVGEVEQMAGKVGGISVVVAARIVAAAGPGEVLVSSTVRDLAAGSGLRFEDRGVRELKGVPGEWHLFVVSRVGAEVVDTDSPSATERRAAAVRRASARPIWQRRPRLVAGTAVLLVIVLATGGLLVVKPWQPAALASVAEDSIGIIDPARDVVIGEIPVGTRPGGIVIGEGSAWVSNTGADSVSQIDLAKRVALSRISVGRAPRGIALAGGSVWVANSGERTVSRIDAATGSVVQTVEVGNGPTAIVASGDGLWVANAGDSTVVHIDAGSGAVGEPVGVASTPISLAADADGLWVASQDGASISHLDPVSGVAEAAPIQLSARPSALALDAGSAWVASADGTVTRIDTASHRVTTTIDVGGSLAAIAVSDGQVWVGDGDGSVSRVDPGDPSHPVHISTSTAVAAFAVVDGGVWVASQASARTHRGGVLRVVDYSEELGRYDTDPLGAQGWYNVSSLLADGLVGYRRVGGAAGSTLVADLATSIPRPTDGGRTYTFQLREGLQYSSGLPVQASDFRRSAERAFLIGSYDYLYGSVVGTESCSKDERKCDLSEGIKADDSARTVTFKLTEPDPDFLYKLANTAGYPVPEGVPMDALVADGMFPGTGPYVVSAITDSEVRLTRNPHFRSWDPAVRPDGFPDEMVFTVVTGDTVAMVEKGDADHTSSFNGASADVMARIRTQYSSRYHAASVPVTVYVAMNTSIPPFDKADARRAVNFAIDRASISEPLAPNALTCQLLSPGFPGHQPYCPYTFHPDAGGRWKAPDIQAAQRLVDASGTRGADVTLGPIPPGFAFVVAPLDEVLRELGYKVTIDNRNVFDQNSDTWWDPKRTQVTVKGWGADYLAPGTFFGLYRCPPFGDVVMNYCDTEYERAFDHAQQLQATDPAAALAEWAALDRRAVDLALMAPLWNGGTASFVSERVGNFQYSTALGPLYDQMWVQ